MNEIVTPKKIKLGSILAGIFLVLTAICFILYFLFKDPYSPFGYSLFMLALPWGSFLREFDYAFLLGIPVNVFIIYKLGNLIGNLFIKKEQQNQVATTPAQEVVNVNKIWKIFNVFIWPIFILQATSSLIWLGIIPISATGSTIQSILNEITYPLLTFILFITLGYTFYSLTNKKIFILLGLVGLIPFFGTIAGYTIAKILKKKYGSILPLPSQPDPTIS